MLFLVLVVLCLCCALYYKKNRKYFELASLVPKFEGYLPIVGHVYALIKLGGIERFWETVKQICENTEQAGGVLTVWAGSKAIFIINDPDDALTTLNSCLEKNEYYKIGFGWCGNGLLTADVPTWKRNRKLLNPTFSQHVLDGFVGVFNQQAALLATQLAPMAGGAAFDPTEYFSEASLEAVCQTAIGISLEDRSVIDSGYKTALLLALNSSAQRLVNYWLHFGFIYRFSTVRKNIDEASAGIHDMSRNVLDKRRAERQQAKLANTAPRRFIAFLDLLLDLAEDGSFSDQQIQDELNIFIGAGVDTSARALVSIMVFLGTHKNIQEKLHQEIMSVLGSSADVGKEDLARLVYTEAVIKETLRLSPVAPFVAREVQTDLKLKNYTMPAGSGCAVMFWGIHRLPMWGSDRLQFRPERWLEPETLPRSSGAFCGFSLGRRNCIGKNYAMMVVKIMLVHLVRKYRISADYSKVKIKFEMLLKYVEGQHLYLEMRE